MVQIKATAFCHEAETQFIRQLLNAAEYGGEYSIVCVYGYMFCVAGSF